MKIKTGEKYLGLDWGEKRIGLALADAETRLALPFATVTDLNSLLKIIKSESVAMVIVGLPFKMAKNEVSNPLFLNFFKQLKTKLNIPIATIDERLSTKAADVLLKGKFNKKNKDEIAAAIILQNWLDLNFK